MQREREEKRAAEETGKGMQHEKGHRCNTIRLEAIAIRLLFSLEITHERTSLTRMIHYDPLHPLCFSFTSDISIFVTSSFWFRVRPGAPRL